MKILCSVRKSFFYACFTSSLFPLNDKFVLSIDHVRFKTWLAKGLIPDRLNLTTNILAYKKQNQEVKKVLLKIGAVHFISVYNWNYNWLNLKKHKIPFVGSNIC